MVPKKPVLSRTSPAVYAWHGFLLAALVLVQGVYLLWWLRNDTRPPAWDESHHLLIAENYSRAIEDRNWEALVRPVFSNYPPLYHLTLSPFMDRSEDVNAVVKKAIGVNIGYLCLLIVAVYFLGEALVSSEAGFCAAAMASFSPIMLWLAHRPMIDMPLAAWVALALLCLVQSDYFEKPWWSLALGLAFGAGMMTKWSFIVYAGVPVAWGFIRAVIGGRWRPILLFLLGAVVVAGPWYAFNGLPSVLKTQKLAAIKEARDPARWSFASATWYLRAAANDGIMWPMALAAVAGIVAAVLSGRWLLLTWMLVPLVFFSSVQNKDLRYYVPALPSLALMIAAVPERFSAGSRRLWFIGWTGLAVFLGVAYGTADRWPAPLQRAAAFAGLEPLYNMRRAPGNPSEMHHDYSSKEDWKTDEILKFIQDRSVAGKLSRVSLISNHPYFQTWNLRFATKVRGWNDIVLFNPKRRLGEFSDFILWKTGDMGPEFTLGYLADAARILQEQPLWLEKTFTRVMQWPLPDGSQAVLFQRDVKSVAWPSALGEVVFELKQFPLPRFEAEGLRVHLVPASAGQAKKGEFTRIVIECDRLDYRGLVLESVRIDGRDVQINLPRLLENRELLFLRVGELRPSVQIGGETLVRYLQARARWLRDPRVALEDGLVRVSGRAHGLPLNVSARAELSPTRDAVTLTLDSARIGPVPLPLFLIRAYTCKTFSLDPSKDLQFPVRMDELTIKNGLLTVRSSS